MSTRELRRRLDRLTRDVANVKKAAEAKRIKVAAEETRPISGTIELQARMTPVPTDYREIPLPATFTVEVDGVRYSGCPASIEDDTLVFHLSKAAERRRVTR